MTALELLKSRESMQAIILFIRSEEAQRIMAAWPMMDPRSVERPLKRNEGYREAFDSLWLAANVDYEDLAKQAEVPLTRCVRTFHRLMKAGIVYPDGTISSHATTLLVSTAIAHVKSQGGRGRSYEGARSNASGEGILKPDHVGLQKGRPPEPGADTVRRPSAGHARKKA